MDLNGGVGVPFGESELRSGGLVGHHGGMRRLGTAVLLIGLAVVWFLVVDTGPSAEGDDTGAVTTSEQVLPPEAENTIALIEAGGPFPYERDGSVFENRERRLPIEDRGYWHEYTVPTPGSDDRGPRRIVAGGDGELYYTDDHYQSFVLVRGGSGGDTS